MQEILTKIEPFADVPVPVEVRIGARTAPVKEVLEVRAGSIVLLDRPAGEPLDILIGNIRLGSVEVVVVEDRLAVRITEIDQRALSLLSEERAIA